MNKTVFAIWGQAQQGKSDTVKRIAQEILAAFPKASTTPKTIDYLSDIQVIITIGEIKIGIESQGDPSSRLFESLAKFSSENCSIIICSTRTSGSTVDAVSALHDSYGYEIIWTTNHRSNEKNHSILNQCSAQQIFGLLQKVLLGML